MASERVELRILGSTELSAADRSGVPVLRQPKRVALLAYLSLAASDSYRRRDHIIALFWPDRDQSHARTQLRKGLHALRRVLGAEAFMARGEDEVRLNLERVWCDAVAFREHFDAGNWQEALDLYRGDLLEGLYPGGVGREFETWLDAQRTSLRELAARAAWEHSNRADLSGQREVAIAAARRAAELSVDDEPGVRRLIAALDRYGDRAGALRVFRAWQERLQQEFGAEPAPETRKLARRVLAPRWGESTETPSMLTADPSVGLELLVTPPVVPALAPASTIENPGAKGRRPALRARVVATVSGAITIIALVSATLVSRYAASRPTAVAVLPLRGLGDSLTVRAAESIAEELTTALAQLPGIAVRSSAQTRDVLKTADDIRAAAERLDVSHLVEGSVTGAGGRLRVAVRIVRAHDGATQWAHAFDIDATDVVGAQQEIARVTVAHADTLVARASMR